MGHVCRGGGQGWGGGEARQSHTASFGSGRPLVHSMAHPQPGVSSPAQPPNPHHQTIPMHTVQHSTVQHSTAHPTSPTCCDEGGCCACRCCALPIAMCARIVAREILLDSRTSGRKVIPGIRPSALPSWSGSRLRSPRCWNALTGSTACGITLARVACPWHRRLDTISRMAAIDSRASMVACLSLRNPASAPCLCGEACIFEREKNFWTGWRATPWS